MNMKTLLIMGLLSLGLSGCTNAQNKQIKMEVKELTKEQKEELKKVYAMYQFSQMQPGIPEGVIVEERTKPLPWIEMQRVLDWSNIKDWLLNAKLEITNSHINQCLSLHGKYIPIANCKETNEYLHCTDGNNSIEAVNELKVMPIKMFGDIRANFISHLHRLSGDSLGFSKFNSNLLISNNEQELALFLKLFDEHIKEDCKGSIEVEFLPPLRWKYTRISLLPEDEGKEYEFDGIKFKLFKSSPGDVIFEYDEKYAEQMDKLNLILMKGQKLVDSGNEKMSGGKEVLQLYKYPNMDFGEWCVTFLGINCDSLGVTPEALQLATEDNYQPTPEELRNFHEVSGEIVGFQLTDLLQDVDSEVSSKSYKEFYQQWVKKGYEAAIEFKGSYYDAMGCFHDRYGNESEPYIGFLRGASIGSAYVKANLKPDWSIIDRCAIAFIEKYDSTNADSLSNVIQKHTEEYIESIVSRKETLSFLTDKDIKSLSKKINKDESPIMYCWYKTDINADAMYIYKPDENLSNKALVKARYYLDGRKPEIIFPE